MNINEYIDQKKQLHYFLLSYIDSETDIAYNYQSLIDFIEYTKLLENKGELREFLHLISILSKYHHRHQNFFEKFEIIIKFLEKDIKKTFTNFEFFLMMKSNKRFLLFLFKTEIIKIDQNIVNFFIGSNKNYCQYFYPEVKEFLDQKLRIKIEEEISYIQNFDDQRKTGENETYLCNLIRNDLIDEFVSYVNKINLPLTTKIKNSLFETNKILQNESSLIEYSAFFGSIQIFKYLLLNNIEINSNLFTFGFCGRNPDIIHLIENSKKFQYNHFLAQLKMSIKCHHNEITEYILNNHIKENEVFLKMEKNYENNIFFFSFHYNNYDHFPSNFDHKFIFEYSCTFGYFKLVEFLLNKHEFDVNKNLYHAANKNKREIVQFLMESSKINLFNPCLFRKCKLTQITIPSTVQEIKEFVFNECIYLTKVIFEKDSQLKKIGRSAFENCKSLKEITIPSSVTYIADFAFRHCSSLIKITIPESVKDIFHGTFQFCSSLVEITIPSSLQFNGCYIFECCSSLKEITIPSSFAKIPSYTFKKCSSLNKVTIPSSVKEIGGYAFSECTSLTEITIPSSMTKIEEYAFRNCFKLAKINLPSSIESIGSGAFSSCSSIVEVVIPSSLRYIERYLFFECKSLEKVVIPFSVASIKANSFEGCSALREIIIPPSVVSIERYAFYNCASLEKVALFCTISSIAESVFDKCTSLKEIKIPKTVSEIRNHAFFQCSSLSRVLISSPLKSIEKCAFAGCSSLGEIYIPNSSVEISISAFPEKTKVLKGKEKCFIC